MDSGKDAASSSSSIHVLSDWGARLGQVTFAVHVCSQSAPAVCSGSTRVAPPFTSGHGHDLTFSMRHWLRENG
jgi:hypothetical protein